MLFSPENHEPLGDEPWDEEHVHSRIRAIVADAEARFDADDLWPPVEDWDSAGGSAPLPLTTLYRGAVREDGLANWAMSVEDCGELDWEGGIRLQSCHGGAGVVASTAPYLDEELLLAGAELVWRAGPGSMTKGPGICHGTAGNGYALLRTFGRTGDVRWLERAQSFALHALGQVERWREQRGRGRASLWAGDIGAALFASDCLDTRAEVPIVDYL